MGRAVPIRYRSAAMGTTPSATLRAVAVAAMTAAAGLACDKPNLESTGGGYPPRGFDVAPAEAPAAADTAPADTVPADTTPADTTP